MVNTQEKDRIMVWLTMFKVRFIGSPPLRRSNSQFFFNPNLSVQTQIKMKDKIEDRVPFYLYYYIQFRRMCIVHKSITYCKWKVSHGISSEEKIFCSIFVINEERVLIYYSGTNGLEHISFSTSSRKCKSNGVTKIKGDTR